MIFTTLTRDTNKRFTGDAYRYQKYTSVLGSFTPSESVFLNLCNILRPTTQRAKLEARATTFFDLFRFRLRFCSV